MTGSRTVPVVIVNASEPSLTLLVAGAVLLGLALLLRGPRRLRWALTLAAALCVLGALI